MTGARIDGAFGCRPALMETPVQREKAAAPVISYPKLLFLLFLLTLPLLNPWVRGDGVGYYAYLRSPLIDHDLNFENDYRGGNDYFVMSRIDANGHLLPDEYTKTGRVENHFTVGPAILWAPVLVPVHFAVVMLDHVGAHIPADGFSRPYLLAMALTTACYGFFSLLLAFRIARKYLHRAVGLPCGNRHLAGQLSSGIHVFQPLLVSRVFRLLRLPVSLVLGPHKIATDDRTMGDPGSFGGTDGERLLSQCHFADLPCA